MIGRGIATRIALAALASAALGVTIVAVGITVVGADVFRALMVEAGESADHAQAMYDQSVTTVVLAAVVVAALASVILAVVLARMLARPLAEVGGAARRIAEGDYAARVPREGPEELASLADLFNQMAASLERQEVMRRDFIANAAHELRTPLTNLQGYLEALRDGVIVADRATYDSLWDEAERLVRLSHSLDALAEGDAATSPPALVELDLVAAIRSALELAQPTFERAGLRVTAELPDRLPARANPDHLAQVLAQPPVQRGALHPGRRDGDGPGRAPRRPTCWSRSPTPATASRRTISTASSSASIGSRSRATGRAAAPASGSPSSSSWSRRAADGSAPNRATGRPGSGSACRPDGQGMAMQTIPTRIPASPTHWIRLSRSPRNATATTIVTAGPNDAASPTIQVGAVSRPMANAMSPMTSSVPASTIAPTIRPSDQAGPPTGPLADRGRGPGEDRDGRDRRWRH